MPVKNGDQQLVTYLENFFMNPLESSISLCRHCRHCRYYFPEGRRGGHCQKLNVSVKSQWNACSLSSPPFLSPWNGLGDLMMWQQKALEVQEAAEAIVFREDLGIPDATTQPVLGIEASPSWV
jgi:hypothetical protein